MEYTIEQYQRVLKKSAEMQNAIDELRLMTQNGIPSWTKFGKCLDAIYRARDEYVKVQHDIVLENANAETIADTNESEWIYETGREEPEILGSGSHLYDVVKTKDAAEALSLAKECGRTYLKRYRHTNCEKIVQWYNQFAKSWME
jgi:coproporphyrinogen III oxidase